MMARSPLAGKLGDFKEIHALEYDIKRTDQYTALLKN